MTDEEKVAKGKEALLKDIDKYVKLLDDKDFMGIIVPPSDEVVSKELYAFSKDVQKQMLLEIKESTTSQRDKTNPFSNMVYTVYYEAEHDRRGINIVLKQMIEIQLELHIADVMHALVSSFKKGEPEE